MIMVQILFSSIYLKAFILPLRYKQIIISSKFNSMKNTNLLVINAEGPRLAEEGFVLVFCPPHYLKHRELYLLIKWEVSGVSNGRDPHSRTGQALAGVSCPLLLHVLDTGGSFL